MKPVQLEATNFGPYRKLKLNFEDLEQAPLFLISGDTGAGKSTLFDAMTVALFSQTTSTRKVEEMRSTFATPEDPLTKIIFYFRQQETLYKIEREIKQEKKAARGSKIIEHKATAKLVSITAVDGIEQEVLASKPSDVGQMIQELLQINAEQFKQIILLPQNEVQKFLHSKTEEKLPILKTIFGTQIFTKFTKSLENAYRDAKKDAESLQQTLADLYLSPSWPEEIKERFQQTPEAEKKAVMMEVLAQHEALVEKQQKTVLNQLERYKQHEKSYEHAAIFQTKVDRLDELTTRYQQEIVELTSQYHEQKNAYAQFQQVQPLLAVLEYQTRDEKKLSELDHEIKSVKQQITITQETQQQLTEQYACYQAKEAEIATKRTLSLQLEEYDQAAKRLTVETNRKQQAFIQLTKQQKQKELLEEQLQLVIAKQVVLKENLEQQVGYETAFHKFYQIKEQCSKWQDELLKLATTHDKLEQSEQQYAQHQASLATKMQQRVKLEAQVVHLESKRRNLMIAQLQAELRPDEPCVVCGSTTHQLKTDSLADESQLLKQLQELELVRKEHQDCQVACAQLEQTLLTLKTQQEEYQQTIAQLKVECETLYGTLTTFSEFSLSADASIQVIKTYLNEQEEVLNQQKEQYETQLVQIESFEQQRVECEQAITESKREETQQQLIFDAAKAEIEQLHHGYPDLDSDGDYLKQKENLQTELSTYDEACTALKNEERQVAQQVLTLQVTLDHLKEQQLAYQQALSETEKKIDTLLPEGMTKQTAIEQLTQVEIAKEWDAFIRRYEEKQSYLAEEIATLKQTVELQEPVDLAQLKVAKEQAEQVYQTSMAYLTRLETILDQMRQVAHSIIAILETQGIKGQRFNELSELYQIIKGVKGSKLKLETYVAQEYLEQVLTHANRHYIKQLTKGRYEFLLNTTQVSGQRDTGLDIDIFDFSTGTIRSTKTLSGGETFIAALSIALSLSEVVQTTTNGALIDALFIDEGFGSLDRDTLEQAMEALEQIGENRMVGVISHVDEMKERIGQQIWIKKLGNGQSTLAVQELK